MKDNEKVIDSVILIDKFEQKCVVIKGMFQTPRLKDHIQTIGIDQYLRKNALYEHKYLENIKKSYKQAGKFDDQKQLKEIIEAAMVFNPEGLTEDSPISPMTSTPVKKPSSRKSLCLFTKNLDAKKKTDTCQIGAAKSKRKAIKYGTTPWSLKKKAKMESKNK